MTEQYYIRIRGRVQGPFDIEKIRQLVRRGQFSRMHEISIDGQQWQPAKDRAELFAAPAVAAATSARMDSYEMAPSPAAESQRGPTTIQPRASSGTSGPQEAWYYVYAGKEQGPIDFQGLYDLFATNRLTADTQVWRHGMPEWTPAHTIPGLVATTSLAVVNPSPQVSTAIDKSAADEVLPDVVRILLESRSWVVFIAVIGFIYAALILVGGLLLVVGGSRTNSTALLGQGLGSMISALIVAGGAWLLMSYAAGISKLERMRRSDLLQSALASLKAFWAFVGIVIIVVLTLIVILVVVLIAVAGSLPSFGSIR